MSDWKPICPETIPRPVEEWHEDMGPMLWWRFPVVEAPYCGSPLDTDWEGHCFDDFFTHFTPIPIPQPPEDKTNETPPVL